MPKLYLGSDHRGFSDKNRVKENLAKAFPDYEVIDLGPKEYDKDDDFNDAAIAVAKAVQEDPTARGILICGSAHGVSIQANRFKGVRAICGYSEMLASLGRRHNNANVLCLSSDYVDDSTLDHSVEAFLRTDFLEEERFVRRNKRLDEEIS